MKARCTAFSLLCATAVDREWISLMLADEWAEAIEVRPVVILDDEDDQAREEKFPSFIACTKDRFCILSFAPRSPPINAVDAF